MPPPRKKDRPTAVCPRCGNNFRPQGRSAAGSQICRAKAARTRAQKQSRAGGRGLCADCAHGGAADIVCGVVLGSDRPGCPPGQRARPGAKTAPGGAGSCAQTTPMGERRTSCAGWCLEGTALGTRWDRGTPGRKNSPRRAPEAVWMRDMGVTCPGRSV